MDALFAFPYLLLAIVIAFLLSSTHRQGIITAAIAITVVYVPQYFRVVRNHVISLREESYVEAARALGARPFTVIRKYVFFNVVQNVPPIATLNAADAILTLAALGFLGYGIQPTEAAEWGYDIQRAVSDAASGIWWTGLFPGLAIVLLVTGLTLLGEGLNETINPVLRSGGAPPSGRVRARRRAPQSQDGEAAVSDARSSRSATFASTTGRRAARCARSTASRSISARARSSASSASRAAGSRRSAAASSASCPEGAAPTARCSTTAGTSSRCRRGDPRGCAARISG